MVDRLGVVDDPLGRVERDDGVNVDVRDVRDGVGSERTSDGVINSFTSRSNFACDERNGSL